MELDVKLADDFLGGRANGDDVPVMYLKHLGVVKGLIFTSMMPHQYVLAIAEASYEVLSEPISALWY